MAAARACRPSLFLISNFLIAFIAPSACNIAVLHMNPEPLHIQAPVELFHQNHRTVPAPRTPQSQGQTGFALALVLWQRKFQERGQTIQKSSGLVTPQDVVFHLPVKSCFAAQLIDKKRIREKPHVENDIRVMGDAVLVAKGDQKQPHAMRTRDLTIILLDLTPELMNVKVACIEHFVRQRPHPFQGFALARNSFVHRASLGERMGPSGLAEAAQEHFVVGIEKQNVDAMASGAQLSENVRPRLEETTLSEIDPEREARNLFPVPLAELDKLRDQNDGEIVDAEKPAVLEDADDVALA